jgi:hypothetical protein
MDSMWNSLGLRAVLGSGMLFLLAACGDGFVEPSAEFGTPGQEETVPAAAVAQSMVTPDLVSGNPSCTDLGYSAGYKWDEGFDNTPPENGVAYPLVPTPTGAWTFTGDAEPFPGHSITFTNVTSTSFDWSSTAPVEAVIVKGGANAHVYHYDPAATSDAGLVSPLNPNNQPAAVSHVEFCIDVPPFQPLQVSKVADASYERTVEWDLEKSVDPTELHGEAGESAGDVEWTVTASKEENSGAFLVEGYITIVNPNDVAVDFSIADVLDDGTEATVTCPGTGDHTGTVPANDQVACAYTAEPENTDAGSNTATVTSLTDGIAGGEASVDFSWIETLIGDDEVTLDDPRFEYEEEISSTTTEIFPESFACPADPTLYEDGTYTFTEKNTATLTGENTDLEADASVEVTCTLPALGVSKTADGSFDLEVEWELEKSVDVESHTGLAGEDAGSSTWTVTATKGGTPANFEVSGTITVTNPSSFARDFSLADELDDGTVANIVCPVSGDATGTVPAASNGTPGSVTCDYTATPANADATENEVTLTSAGNDAQTATADVEWTATETGDSSAILADDRFDFEETISSTTTETFPETFTCPADPALYEDGSYTFQVPNLATLTGDETDLSDNASVEVTCTLPALGVSKTADGSFDRTVEWTLEKSVDQDTFSGGAGESFDAIWTVVATKSTDDGNFGVSGTITVTNPSSFARDFSLADQLDDGTVASITCPGTDDHTGTVPGAEEGEDGSLSCTYEAFPADAGAEENTVTLSSEGRADETAKADIEWTANVTGDDETTLADDRFEYSELISGSSTVTFPETFTCPIDPEAYAEGIVEFTEVNEATLTGPNTNLDADASVQVTCLPPESETAWAANGDEPGSLRYVERGNWATYVDLQDGESRTVSLFAGQTRLAGSVTFTVEGDQVRISLELGQGWFFDPTESIHIQDYAEAPAGNPAPGRFEFRATSEDGTTAEALVPLNAFYGVHAVVFGPPN